MIKYQGDDIEFLLEIDNSIDGGITSFNQLSKIKIACRSCGSKVVKYAYPHEDGYNDLSVTESQVYGILNSEDTRLMSGDLIMTVGTEISSEDGDGTKNSTKEFKTGITIQTSVL